VNYKIRNIKPVIITALLSCVLLFTSCVPDFAVNTSINDNELNVIVFDVGQADCIYIKTPEDENILIDAANNGDGGYIVSYLASLGVKKIDYFFLTHPHADHIGGADDIIENFEIKNIYMPKVYHDTKTYEEVLKSAKAKGLKIKAAKPEIINLSSCVLRILSPVKEKYNDLNSYSIVIKLSYYDFDMLFMGDLPKEQEKDILNNDLSADIIKIGHHGSQYSTSEDLLNKSKSSYAIISAGEDNDYGHPYDKTLRLLEKHNIAVYRTDYEGDIIINSDGKEINIDAGNKKSRS